MSRRYNTGLTDVPATEHGLIPGWNDKVCPQVTGLPASEGEFILGRISQIARAAVVPMAGEHCSPNLFIFVTAGPTQLLRSMEKTSSAFTFGPHALPTVLDQFIATPRPVRAWYNIGVGGAVMPFKFAFSRVTVIVDQTRLLGVSRGQLADYVALVGLTEVRPAAHLGDAPTILKLFAGMLQAAPAGLTDWDQAFLKSVYSTATWPQAWKRRQDQLASSMVLQIVP